MHCHKLCRHCEFIWFMVWSVMWQHRPQILSSARKQFGTGGDSRITYTLPALIFSTYRLVNMYESIKDEVREHLGRLLVTAQSQQANTLLCCSFRTANGITSVRRYFSSVCRPSWLSLSTNQRCRCVSTCREGCQQTTFTLKPLLTSSLLRLSPPSLCLSVSYAHMIC